MNAAITATWLSQQGLVSLLTEYQRLAAFMNRRMPNGTYGGVRGGGREAPAYSIPAPAAQQMLSSYEDPFHGWNRPMDVPMERVDNLILAIRGHRVILDADLAVQSKMMAS